jgi:hypothetical protein
MGLGELYFPTMTRHNKLTNDSAWKVPHTERATRETFDVCCLLSWQGKFKLSVAIMVAIVRYHAKRKGPLQAAKEDTFDISIARS